MIAGPPTRPQPRNEGDATFRLFKDAHGALLQVASGLNLHSLEECTASTTALLAFVLQARDFMTYVDAHQDEIGEGRNDSGLVGPSSLPTWLGLRFTCEVCRKWTPRF
jgi:hypothetical protein